MKRTNQNAWLIVGLFFLFCSSIISAESYIQDDQINWNILITLPRKNLPFRTILKDVEEQAGIFFIFDDSLIDDIEMMLPATAEPLQQVMRRLLLRTNLATKTFPPDAIVLYKIAEPPERNIKTIEKTPEPFKPITLVPPELLSSDAPQYPDHLKNKHQEGTANVNLLIGRLGKVNSVELVHSSGNDDLDKAAHVFAYNMQFKPAKQGDKPVEIWINYDIVYRLISDYHVLEECVRHIREMRQKLANVDLIDRDMYLEKLLEYISEFVNQEERWPVLRINSHVNMLLSARLINEWKQYAPTHRLGFLIFHEYIRQYSENTYIENAQKQLGQCLKVTLESMSSTELPKFQLEANQKFLKDTRLFLQLHYPHLLEDVIPE